MDEEIHFRSATGALLCVCVCAREKTRNVQTLSKTMRLFMIQCRLMCHIQAICQKLIFVCFAILLPLLEKRAHTQIQWGRGRGNNDGDKKKTSVDKHSSRCDTNLGPNAAQKRRMDGHGHGEIARRRQGKPKKNCCHEWKQMRKHLWREAKKKCTREFELLHDSEKHKRREEREKKKKQQHQNQTV